MAQEILFGPNGGWLSNLAAGASFAMALVCGFILTRHTGAEPIPVVPHAAMEMGKISRRWRLYSLLVMAFLALMLAFLFYGQFAAGGIRPALFPPAGDDPVSPAGLLFRWVCFSMGFIFLPVFLMEYALASSESGARIGISLHYRDNFRQKFPPSADTMPSPWPLMNRLMEKHPKFLQQASRTWQWFLTYVVMSLLFLHIVLDWRKADLSIKERRWQCWIDVVLWVHFCLFLIGCAVVLHGAGNDSGKWLAVVVLAYIILLYVNTLAFIQLVGSGGGSTRGRVATTFGSSLLIVAFLIDLTAPKWVFQYAAEDTYLNVFPWAYQTLAYPTHGLFPLFLLLSGWFVGKSFFGDWLRLFDLRRERLEKELGELTLKATSVDFQSRMMHRVGNFIQAPLTALELTRTHLASQPDTGGTFRQTLDAQVENGLAALEELKKELGDFKRNVRNQHQPEWMDAASLLQEQLARAGEGHLTNPLSGKIEVHACRADFEETLANLLENAHYAVRKQEHKRVEARLEWRRNDHFPLVLSIEDNGSGIDADALPRVQDAYYSTNAGGSGLGLFLAAQFMRHLGGDIRVESRKAGELKHVEQWVSTRITLSFPSDKVRILK